MNRHSKVERDRITEMRRLKTGLEMMERLGGAISAAQTVRRASGVCVCVCVTTTHKQEAVHSCFKGDETI